MVALCGVALCSVAQAVLNPPNDQTKVRDGTQNEQLKIPNIVVNGTTPFDGFDNGLEVVVENNDI